MNSAAVMPLVLVFDVYGTLVDTSGVTATLMRHVGAEAVPFARAWREKQLEYTFRRGLMRQYVDFVECTAQALAYVAQSRGIDLSASATRELLAAYRVLPVFGDVQSCLWRALSLHYRLFALSNGRRDHIHALLKTAGVEPLFEDIISVDEVQTYKPDPVVYRHFCTRTDMLPDHCWLVSCNPFDVIGAIAAGLRAVWVKRDPHVVFDPWDIKPTLTVTGLEHLLDAITALQKN